AMILGILSETEEKSLEYIVSLTRRNEKNFDITRIFKKQHPFPHENIYRRTIRYGLNFSKVRSSPVKIYIQAIEAIPKKKDRLGDFINKAKLISQTARAYILDEIDKEKGLEAHRVQKIVEKWNLKEVIYTNEDLNDERVLEQIILNSSSIPPVVGFQSDDQVYYLDGGLTNNLLLEVFPLYEKKIGIYYEKTTIIGKDPKVLENTLLIYPSRPLKITSFDYTNPEGLIDTFQLGRQDAEAKKEEVLEFTKKAFFESLFT
ncbi:MAG: patatin-like phospholipase family protein, partial [Leptospiraceae bacterium]|nr:patatin-like phospholipase family protein [Leptospiraceae bacterium]